MLFALPIMSCDAHLAPYALHNMVEPQGLLTIAWYRALANNHVYNWLQLFCHLQQGA